MHGMMWPHLAWSLVETAPDRLTASFDWSKPQGLVVFPYPCRLTMTAIAEPASLTIETSLTPTSDIGVPVSFGFHPYIGLPDVPREAVARAPAADAPSRARCAQNPHRPGGTVWRSR